MKRFFLIAISILILQSILCAADTVEPKIADERIVLSTDFGDLVLALYPDIAPQHVNQLLNLVRLRAFDGTHIFRVNPNFIIQVSDIHHRSSALNDEQIAAEKPIPAEFSNTLKHHKGVLSMARWDDPNSATSSFSILLNSAPHLDGKYTIFGRLESGGSVVNNILSVARDKEFPIQRITINRAFIVTDMVAYYNIRAFDPIQKIGNSMPVESQSRVIPQSKSSDLILSDNTILQMVSIVVSAVIFICLLAYFLYDRISKARLLSLLLINVLLCSFLLFILLVPIGHSNSWIAALVFVGLFGMFRLMSQFESKR